MSIIAFIGAWFAASCILALIMGFWLRACKKHRI